MLSLRDNFPPFNPVPNVFPFNRAVSAVSFAAAEHLLFTNFAGLKTEELPTLIREIVHKLSELKWLLAAAGLYGTGLGISAKELAGETDDTFLRWRVLTAVQNVFNNMYPARLAGMSFDHHWMALYHRDTSDKHDPQAALLALRAHGVSAAIAAIPRLSVKMHTLPFYRFLEGTADASSLEFPVIRNALGTERAVGLVTALGRRFGILDREDEIWGADGEGGGDGDTDRAEGN